jgi:transposase
MYVIERNRGKRRRLARLITKESDAIQRDRLQSVLVALQGREPLEIAGTLGRSRAFVQRWAYTYRDGGIEAVRGRTAPGRERRLAPHHETASRHFVDDRSKGFRTASSVRPSRSPGSTNS